MARITISLMLKGFGYFLTKEEEDEFQSALTCYSCFIPFHHLRDPEKDKMRDHCHITGYS